MGKTCPDCLAVGWRVGARGGVDGGQEGEGSRTSTSVDNRDDAEAVKGGQNSVSVVFSEDCL